MAYMSKFSPDGGTTLLDLKDKNARLKIGPIEESSTASRAYSVGDLFWYNDLLYKTTATITSGGTITPNTNCKTITVSEAIKEGGTFAPNPAATPSESTVVTTINAKYNTPGNTEIPSLYSVSRWSNEKTKTFIIKGAASNSPIGSTGVGEWQDPSTLTNPSESDEIGWGWWYIPEFDEGETGVDIGAIDGVTINPVFDPGESGEAIVLGGYIIDTSTGYCCIRFGNTITDTENVAVGFEVTYKRNEVSVLPLQPTP